MSDSYMFFMPSRLPLALEDFGPDYALDMPTGPFPDREALVREISLLFPGIQWKDGQFLTWASATSNAGWVEPHLHEHEGLYWSLRCSMRGDYAAVVQSICDRTGWVAIDPQQQLIQPHRPPFRIE